MVKPSTEFSNGSEPRPMIGFYGKLPSRGDFVSRGLPGSLTVPWHDWAENMLTVSRQYLDQAWLPAWLKAPIWMFRLPPGHCGPTPFSGVILPSVDRAGRHFPLMLGMTLWVDESADLTFLADAGCDAIDRDLDPDRLMADLAIHAVELSRAWDAKSSQPFATWQTLEAAHNPLPIIKLDRLPSGEQFAAMMSGAPVAAELARAV